MTVKPARAGLHLNTPNCDVEVRTTRPKQTYKRYSLHTKPGLRSDPVIRPFKNGGARVIVHPDHLHQKKEAVHVDCEAVQFVEGPATDGLGDGHSYQRRPTGTAQVLLSVFNHLVDVSILFGL
jgi:hypothetical protein